MLCEGESVMGVVCGSAWHFPLRQGIAPRYILGERVVALRAASAHEELDFCAPFVALLESGQGSASLYRGFLGYSEEREGDKLPLPRGRDEERGFISNHLHIEPKPASAFLALRNEYLYQAAKREWACYWGERFLDRYATASDDVDAIGLATELYRRVGGVVVWGLSIPSMDGRPNVTPVVVVERMGFKGMEAIEAHMGKEGFARVTPYSVNLDDSIGFFGLTAYAKSPHLINDEVRAWVSQRMRWINSYPSPVGPNAASGNSAISLARLCEGRPQERTMLSVRRVSPVFDDWIPLDPG